MSWRVLLTDRAWPDSSIEQRELAVVGAELIEAPEGSESTLTRLAVDVDAIMTCWAPVTESVVRAAVKCRQVAATLTGSHPENVVNPQVDDNR